MRFLGLTLCLLASSFGARAESVEERVAALEARVKVLEAALQNKPATAVANIDGSYKAVLPDSTALTAEFDHGKVIAITGGETKTGTYEIIGQRVIVTAGDKTAVLTIDGAQLHMQEGDNKIDFIKTK